MNVSAAQAPRPRRLHEGHLLVAFFVVLILMNVAFYAVAFTQPVDLLPAAEQGHGPR